ncbi:MAG TPA: terminase large subunit [Erysipelotrichaceae bacterium]|nr:terminase large subunit [Erysipelotrichaceae bacterium]
MNYIFAYYQAINDGTEEAGIWIHLIYQIIVEGIEDGTYIFSAKKANRAISFIEKFCRHNKGKLGGHLLQLDLWEKAALSCMYGVLDHDGRRQFTEIFMIVGRKCGKTLIASAVMSYEAYADGEFGSEIYCVAPKLDQSDLVYSAFEFTKDHTPSFAQITDKRKTDLYIKKTNTTIKKIAFNEKKADGYNPMLTVCDEMAAWPAERGLKQYEVMVSGTGARDEPLTLSISSAGYVNGGIYDELFTRGTRFLKGGSGEKHFLPLFYMIDDVTKWDDINELKKSLPGLGVSVSVKFILAQIDTARESLSKKAEFMTKYCNIKQNSSQAWLDAITVQKACGEHLELEDFRGSYCIGGIDLSQTTDLTACTAVIQKNGILYVFAKFFLPAEKIDEATERDGLPYRAYIQRGLLQPSGDNFIDYHDAENWFLDLINKYEIYPLKVGYDRYSAQYLVNDMKAYGFHMDDVYQGENLYPVIQEVEGLMKDGVINIGDNDLLKIHLLNSAIKMSTERGRGKLVKLSPTVHIDGTASLLDAFTVRQKWWSEVGNQLANER